MLNKNICHSAELLYANKTLGDGGLIGDCGLIGRQLLVNADHLRQVPGVLWRPSFVHMSTLFLQKLEDLIKAVQPAKWKFSLKGFLGLITGQNIG